MEEDKVYTTADESKRREFFGIDASSMKEQAFSLHDRQEVVKFSELLESFVEEESHLPFHSIKLPRWFDKCQRIEGDGRLFAAIQDLKITVAFLFIDFIKSCPDSKSINRQDNPDVLSDADLFRKKMKMMHELIDMAIRFRAFYDKFMGVQVLLFCPERYNSYISAKSRKNVFREMMKEYIASDSLDSLFDSINHLDERFRTPEVHQAGSMRKWVLSSQDYFIDNYVDLTGYFNNVIGLCEWLDEVAVGRVTLG